MIGSDIAALLRASSNLMELVSTDNIFPYVAEEKTPLPLIIYTIDGLDPNYTKDGWVNDIIDFTILSIADDYDQLQNIVSEARAALELKHTTDSKRIIVTGQQEGFNIDESVFLNRMNFSIEIINH